MENNTWIKLYRKVVEHEVFHDETAFRVFIWILCTVDYKTGTKRSGRFWASSILDIKPITYYYILKRLEKKYDLITQESNNRYTTITVKNWKNYQLLDNNNDNNKVTTKQQQNNTTQELRIKNKENTYKEKPLKKKILKKEKTYTKENLTIQEVANKLVEHFEAENNRKSKLAPNSYKNLAYWLEVYEPNEIAEAISQIKYDSFWKDKMDLTILFRQSSKGEPVNWIDTLLNKKKENYARR